MNFIKRVFFNRKLNKFRKFLYNINEDGLTEKEADLLLDAYVQIHYFLWMLRNSQFESIRNRVLLISRGAKIKEQKSEESESKK